MTLSAWEGWEKLPQRLQHGGYWETPYRTWAGESYDQVRGSLACVPGDIVHLYHGTRKNRQYVERYQIFHDHAYHPVRDLEIDPETGLLQRTDEAREREPDLVPRVAHFLSGAAKMNDGLF